ncbi:hypothetical protein DPMN_153753 [Dreissena polymorpha]|uniref:Uncharacterized protein n=1 Tax=Dreissena polymorpha TaxID=45954 RepID=A0A9D4FNP9_DREPO|nr:hypothetical protein DPMN_153753 [Dreissena polymorpha]
MCYYVSLSNPLGCMDTNMVNRFDQASHSSRLPAAMGVCVTPDPTSGPDRKTGHVRAALSANHVFCRIIYI